MKKAVFFLTLTLTIFFTQCDVLKEVQIPGSSGLTKDEIVRGLKEALKTGTTNAIKTLAKENGFYLDETVKIPFPQQVDYVEKKLRALGLGSLIDNFVERMNHAAEQAVSKAGPIFYDAITQMTITDALDILHGADDAATQYFREKTYPQLVETFKPDITRVLNQVHLAEYWDKVTKAYNKIPFTKKVEEDLPQYVTEKTIDGLFVKLAREEKLIRTDPEARVTDILKKVFAQAGQ